MKKLLLALLCLTLFFSFSSCSKNSKYQIVVEQINEQLPVDYPGGVRIEKAELVGDIFRYYYTFLENPKMTVEEFVSSSRTNIISLVRNHSELKIFRADKMTIAFVFQKEDGSVFAEIKITPEDYK